MATRSGVTLKTSRATRTSPSIQITELCFEGCILCTNSISKNKEINHDITEEHEQHHITQMLIGLVIQLTLEKALPR
jgi:hypothetical protein